MQTYIFSYKRNRENKNAGNKKDINKVKECLSFICNSAPDIITYAEAKHENGNQGTPCKYGTAEIGG